MVVILALLGFGLIFTGFGISRAHKQQDGHSDGLSAAGAGAGMGSSKQAKRPRAARTGAISQKNRDCQRMIAMGYRRAASETYSAECCLRRTTLHLKQKVKKDDDGESCRNFENTFDSFTIVTNHAMKLDGNMTIPQFLRDLSGSRWQCCIWLRFFWQCW